MTLPTLPLLCYSLTSSPCGQADDNSSYTQLSLLLGREHTRGLSATGWFYVFRLYRFGGKIFKSCLCVLTQTAWFKAMNISAVNKWSQLFAGRVRSLGAVRVRRSPTGTAHVGRRTAMSRRACALLDGTVKWFASYANDAGVFVRNFLVYPILQHRTNLKSTATCSYSTTLMIIIDSV
jgi:hypothetical protein